MHVKGTRGGVAATSDVQDDPFLPEVTGKQVSLKEALRSRHVYEMLEKLGLKLGYEPNRFGLWSRGLSGWARAGSQAAS